jgi:hypothetical protein
VITASASSPHPVHALDRQPERQASSNHRPGLCRILGPSDLCIRASSSRSQLPGQTARAVACLTSGVVSAVVHQRPWLVVVEVTHLGTRSLTSGPCPRSDDRLAHARTTGAHDDQTTLRSPFSSTISTPASCRAVPDPPAAAAAGIDLLRFPSGTRTGRTAAAVPPGAARR